MDKTEKYYLKMTTTSVEKLIVTLGIPTTISMLITNIYNLVDTYFVGSLGESQQAATGVLFTLQFIIQAFAFMFGHGSGVYVSKELANKDVEKASKYVTSAIIIGVIVGLVISIFGLIFLELFMKILGSTDTILPYAKDYGLWVLISCPFMIVSLILNNNLRYEGKAFYSMIGLSVGAILNIFGDYLLIDYLEMGVYGAGLSTAISQIVSCTILFIFFMKMAQSKIRFSYISKDVKLYLNICKVGLPSLIRQGLSSISNGLLNNLTKQFGDAAIAAMSVVNRFSSFVMCVGLGIGQGFQPVSSFNYEAKEYKRVKKGFVFTMLFGFVLVGLLSLFGLIIPEKIIWLFQKSENVISVGTFALRMASIGVMFLPISVTVNMLYQSIRKAKTASFLSLLRSGLTFIPILLIGVHFFGLAGIQCAQPISDILSSLISLPFGLHFLGKTPNK